MGFFSSILDFFFGSNDDDFVNDESNTKKSNKNVYHKKELISDCEKYFYSIMSDNIDEKYIVFPQVNLASIIEKEKDFPGKYQNELYRNIDFGIFEKSTMEVKLLIEINDKTHNEPKRIERDKKVKEICDIAGIKLITFYTKYVNKKDYIIKRINDNLK